MYFENILRLLKYWIDNHSHTNACATNVPPKGSKEAFFDQLKAMPYFDGKVLYNDSERRFEMYEKGDIDGKWILFDSWSEDHCTKQDKPERRVKSDKYKVSSHTDESRHRTNILGADNEKLSKLFEDIELELAHALSKFAPFNSPHEAYGVLCEELAEVFEHVRLRTEERTCATDESERRECIQLAAMAIRYVLDLIP